ncbi:hypothetical protein [Nitrospira sp. Kam-Ns4a]
MGVRGRIDDIKEITRAFAMRDKLQAAGYRPTPGQIEPGDWVWWQPRRGESAVERPLCRVELRDGDWYIVADYGPHSEWRWTWVPYAAITSHVPAAAVRARKKGRRTIA